MLVNSFFKVSTSADSVEDVVILVVISFSLALSSVIFSFFSVIYFSTSSTILVDVVMISLSSSFFSVATSLILVNSSLNLVAASCFSMIWVEMSVEVEVEVEDEPPRLPLMVTPVMTPG